MLVEVPLHELQPKAGPAKATLDVHCSLAALVKDAKGEVVQKLTRDRSFQVTPEQLKLGNFLDKMTVTLPPGKYTPGKRSDGSARAARSGRSARNSTVPAKAAGVSHFFARPDALLHAERQRLDPNDPFQFQGGSVTPDAWT